MKTYIQTRELIRHLEEEAARHERLWLDESDPELAAYHKGCFNTCKDLIDQVTGPDDDD